ncbi:type II secretion system F family protein [Halosimplex aquaticum]
MPDDEARPPGADSDVEADPREEWTARREETDDLGADHPDGRSDRDTAVTADGEALGDTDTEATAAHNPEESFLRPSGATAGFESIDREDLREHYGPIRTFFKRRAGRYQAFQRRLTQAWLRDTYDIYLAAMVGHMILIVAAAVALALVASVGLLAAAHFWTLSGLTGATGLSVPALAGSVAGALVAGGVVAAGLYYLWRRVYRVRMRIDRRRREIDYNLPYALTFMYALSRAGVSFDRILVRLADAEETYGAVSQEFDRVVRDVEVFGNNLYIGLENLRAVTPSTELRRFTDDITTVLESGGDISGFLRDEVDDQLDAAVEAQEAYVERLELLSEVFVVGFVAAPLFLLVVLIVVSFLGEETLDAIRLLIYVAIPLALTGFAVLIDVVSQPFRSTPVEFSPGRARPAPPAPARPTPTGERSTSAPSACRASAPDS